MKWLMKATYPSFFIATQNQNASALKNYTLIFVKLRCNYAEENVFLISPTDFSF